MATEFKYLVFSVFGISDFGKFTDAVIDLFDKELRVEGRICQNSVFGKIACIRIKCFLYPIMRMAYRTYAGQYRGV